MNKLSVALLEKMLDHAQEYMVLCDESHLVLYANSKAEIFFDLSLKQEFKPIFRDSITLIETVDLKGILNFQKGKNTYYLAVESNKIQWEGEAYTLYGFRDCTAEQVKIFSLEESEHTLRQLIDLVPHAIFLKDSERRFMIVNKAVSDHHHLSKEDMLGKRDEDFFNEIDVESFINDEIKILETKEPLFIMEESFTTKEGEYKVMETIKVPFYIQSNKEWGILGVAIDITKREQLREEQNQMRQQHQNSLMKAVVDTQERERTSIAHDLHDGLGQLLTASKMNLNAFTSQLTTEVNMSLLKSEQLLEQSIQEVRAITQDLVPGVLNDFGLITALERLVESYQGNTKTKLTFRKHSVEEELIRPIEKNLYRICQEALNNAIKYSQAKEVSIQLFKRGSELILQIEDDGVGFDLDTVLKHNKGLGLKSIINRVGLMNGEMDISTSKGRGCEYSIIIYLDKLNDEQN